MDIGQWTVIVLSALFLAWFLLGTTTNRRRGDQILRWVQGGTKPLGRMSEARRIRGSAVQLTIKDAAGPFRQVDLIVALEPRENPPLWLYNHLLGKRDELVIQAKLRSTAQQELEINRVGVRKTADKRASDVSQLKKIESSAGNYTVGASKGIDPAMFDCLEIFLAKYGSAVEHFSLKRSPPHVQVHLLLSPLLDNDPELFFIDLQKLLVQEK
jgi:hypothetical protein